MISKTFEIRDEGTYIPVLAIKLSPECEADRHLLARSGYGNSPESQARYIIVIKIAGGPDGAHSDPMKWQGDTRTMPTAHLHIREHFDELEAGAVIDVEFLLGETDAPKLSERLTAGTSSF